MNQSSIENVKPEPKLNSEPKDQDKQVSPSIANAMLAEVMSAHPSICYGCVHARKPASDENIKKGYVGCCLRSIDVFGKYYDIEEIESAKEIAEGWVDLRSRLKFGKGSGIINNFQLLTLETKSCKQFKELF